MQGAYKASAKDCATILKLAVGEAMARSIMEQCGIKEDDISELGVELSFVQP